MKKDKIPMESRLALTSAMLGITNDSPHYEELQRFLVVNERKFEEAEENNEW